MIKRGTERASEREEWRERERERISSVTCKDDLHDCVNMGYADGC